MNPLLTIGKLRLFIDRLLKQHFFQPTAPQSLSLFRILYCAALIWSLADDRDMHLAKFSRSAWNPIPLFELFGVGLMSTAQFQALFSLLIAALVLTAIGLATRVSATVAWIAFFLYMGTYLGFDKSPDVNYVIHSHNMVVVILFILSLVPGVSDYGVDGWIRRRRWSLGEHAQASAWPIQLIKLTFCLAYFGAGYCKVASNPFWADGYTLQHNLMAKYLVLDCEPGHWVAQSWWLCLVLGIATLALELTFFLIVFYPRLTWFYVFGAICFHTAVNLTMRINFFPYFGCTFLIFLSWPVLVSLANAPQRLFAWLATPARRTSQPSIAPAPTAPSLLTASPPGVPQFIGDSPLARAFILTLWGVLLVCIYGRIESWPLTDYGVYAGRRTLSELHVYRLGAIDEQGRIHWIHRNWTPMSPTSFHRRVHAHRRSGEDAKLVRMLGDLAPYVAHSDQDGRFRSVVIVERTVSADPKTGELVIANQPREQVSLAECASRPIVEFTERDLHIDDR
jgi:hypothetical protein